MSHHHPPQNGIETIISAACDLDHVRMGRQTTPPARTTTTDGDMTNYTVCLYRIADAAHEQRIDL